MPPLVNNLTVQQKFKLAALLRILRPSIDLIGLIAITALLLIYLPSDILNEFPATGGDTGSHFWPLQTLTTHGIPQFTLKVWNPGNLAGEPQLLHYFPFPFLLMALFSLFMPLGTAFNIGTVVGLFLLPLSFYFACRCIKLKFPFPLIGTALSALFLYNESFSMWGGNTLSTMAGQFAHGYALAAFIFGLGFIFKEMRSGKFPLGSILCLTIVLLSHAYVALSVPFLLLSVTLFTPFKTFKYRFKRALLIGTSAFTLSAWFIIPMLDNNSWTTPFPLLWPDGTFVDSFTQSLIWPSLLVISAYLGLSLSLRLGNQPLLSIYGKIKHNETLPTIILLLFINLFFYFIFPSVGLVDIRALPQIQLLILLLSSISLAAIMRPLGHLALLLLALPLTTAVLFIASSQVKNFPHWAKWNYSGWQSKSTYPTLIQLSGTLAGDFSMPRVIYEHDPYNEATGSMRVFEMLPYFANRATLESLYLQANILSRPIYHLQAMVSAQPSCPFINQQCPTFDLDEAKAKLELFAVGELILSSNELVTHATSMKFLDLIETFTPWHLFKFKQQPSYASVIAQLPVISNSNQWKLEFFEWFKAYDGSQPFIISTSETSPQQIDNLNVAIHSLSLDQQNLDQCTPTVKVDFNTIELQTNCTGKIHLLKFAYHPSWKSSTGDETYLISPGMIAIIPSEKIVQLKFAQSRLWSIAPAISLLSFFVIATLFIIERKANAK